VAVTYQCVRTIASIYPNESLLLEAASVLSKFLEPKSTNNMKFLGIQALSMLYRTSPKLLDEHQLIIVDCLESKDETLKK
jgi:AP-4 complex subunit epsilon-1